MLCSWYMRWCAAGAGVVLQCCSAACCGLQPPATATPAPRPRLADSAGTTTRHGQDRAGLCLAARLAAGDLHWAKLKGDNNQSCCVAVQCVGGASVASSLLTAYTFQNHRQCVNAEKPVKSLKTDLHKY